MGIAAFCIVAVFGLVALIAWGLEAHEYDWKGSAAVISGVVLWGVADFAVWVLLWQILDHVPATSLGEKFGAMVLPVGATMVLHAGVHYWAISKLLPGVEHTKYAAYVYAAILLIPVVIALLVGFTTIPFAGPLTVTGAVVVALIVVFAIASDN